jgi:hypothetical protein
VAFNFQIEIRNTKDQLVDLLQTPRRDEGLKSTRWQYDALGGCGACDIVVRRPFDDYGDLALDYDVQIWREEDVYGSPGGTPLPAQLDQQLGVGFTNSKELRWSGFIRQFTPVLDRDEEMVKLSCAGYSRQAAYIVVPDITYQSMDVAAIARAIVDTYIVPSTKIKRTGALNLMPDSGVVVSGTGLRFFTSAYEAIKTLADIAGSAEWGVRADREFYFLPRSTAVKQTWEIGSRVAFYQPETSSDDVVNRVYVQGAGGVKYAIDNLPAAAGYQKERVEHVNSIATSSDAALWALGYFAKFGTAQKKGQLRLGATDAWIENFAGQTMPPLGRLRVHGGPIFVLTGETFTGDVPFTLAGSYGAYVDDQYRINSIGYSPSENGLDIAIDLGEKRGALADYFNSIVFKLGELRQGLL